MIKRRLLRPTGLPYWILIWMVVILPALASNPFGRSDVSRTRIARAAAITPTIEASFAVPGNRARGLTWGAGSLWLADEDNNVYRLNPTNGAVQATFPITFTADG